MIITYYGKQFFKIQQGDLVIATNPGSDGKNGRFGADIALSTIKHEDYNGIDTVTYGEQIPFAIKGAGDYEVKGISIKGIPVNAKIGDKDHINTIYSFSVDDISICFLGFLTSPNLTSSAIETIDSADILFVPVGKDTLKARDAYNLAVSLEPKIIIPMDYEKSDLSVFLKEGGEEGTKPVEKLTLKRKDLEGKEGEIVVLDF